MRSVNWSDNDADMPALRADVLARIADITSADLAALIVATDIAALRDNLAYSARRSGVAYGSRLAENGREHGST